MSGIKIDGGLIICIALLLIMLNVVISLSYFENYLVNTSMTLWVLGAIHIAYNKDSFARNEAL